MIRSRSSLFELRLSVIGTRKVQTAETYIIMVQLSSKELSFNDMPNALAYLIEKVEKIETLLDTLPAPKAGETNKWMSLKELQAYLPDHPAAPTVYGWVREGRIPYYKNGKKLSFLKREIDGWLLQGRQKTAAELREEAINHINNRRLGK